ncbi:MAG: YoaK family protein [Acidimicrobiales bacterium]
MTSPVVPPAAKASDRGLLVVLVALTAATGLVDAISYLAIGRVFVANMTDNVVFLGFALVGAKGLSIAASLVALAAFLIGAALGGRLGAALHDRRRRWMLVDSSEFPNDQVRSQQCPNVRPRPPVRPAAST